jgi:hypothetical protein
MKINDVDENFHDHSFPGNPWPAAGTHQICDRVRAQEENRRAGNPQPNSISRKIILKKIITLFELQAIRIQSIL